MRRRLAGLSLASLLIALPAAAQSHDNPWLVRVRAIAIAPDASSTPAGLDVNAAATVEVDFTRRLSKLFAAELIVATAAHDVRAGTTSLGSVTHLPPTLTLQFKPEGKGAVHPYVGAGGNLTFFYNKTGDLEALDLTTSVGWAAQAGLDVDIGGRGVFNLDAKYVDLATDVKSGATTAYRLKINPFVIGLGFGYRF